VRITADGGVSPFKVVTHDVTVRGSTAVLTLAKESLCHPGQQERVRLLEGQEAQALLAALDAAGVWDVRPPPGATEGRARDRPAPLDEQRFEVWVGKGKEMRRFFMKQSALLAAPAVLAVVMAVREAVSSRVEPLPMRDTSVKPGKVGYLSITASEPGRAILDGFESHRLPVDGLDVPEGEHLVRVEGDSGRFREFRVKVTAGAGTAVHVVLE